MEVAKTESAVRQFAILVAAVIMSVVGLAGCGDDAGEESTTKATTGPQATQADEGLPAYCEVANELDEQDGPPTAEQLRRLSDVSPPGIKEDTSLVAERFAAEGMNSFNDLSVKEALGNIESWNQEKCRGPAGGGGASGRMGHA